MLQRTMNTQTKLSASRLTVMTLACLMAVCLAACGGDDDEPTVDELLSTATTQVEFRLPNDRHTYTMYDCAGSHLVGTYTTAGGEKCTLSLRQGKHHIVWFMDFDNESVKYEPEDNALTALSEDGMASSVYYQENDLDVSPYAMEMQHVSCYKEATCRLVVTLADVTENLALPDGNDKIIGRVTGLPLVRTVSLSDSKYKTDGNVKLNIYSSYKIAPENHAVFSRVDEWRRVITLLRLFSLGSLCNAVSFPD